MSFEKRQASLGGFPCGSDGKESASYAGDPGSIPWWGRSCGGGSGNPLLYSCLKNPMDREAWLATVYGVVRSQIRLSDLAAAADCILSEYGLKQNSLCETSMLDEISATKRRTENGDLN